MAIDLLTETVLSLSDAAAALPRRRGGRKVHPSCVYRWVQRGLKGIRLECVQVGGTKCTSQEALARFFEALTYGADRPPVRSPAKRRRDAELAMRELDREGV